MSKTQMIFDIVANNKASKTISQISGEFDTQQSKIKGFAVGSAVALAAAGAGLVAFASGAVAAAEEGKQAEAKLANVTDQMGLFGSASGAVTDRLVEFADAQARATGVDDDAIIATQTKLATFKELAATADDMGGMFDRATTAALDMAAAGFGSAEDNAVQLGKALNDPIKGITALSRSGVTFTEGEKDMIRAMVEAGDMAGAQGMIMKALETQVGGTAAASASSADKMRVGWDQFQESVGTRLLPVIEAMQTFISDKLLPAVQSFADNGLDYLTPKVQALVTWFQDNVLPVVQTVASFITNTVVPAFDVFWVALTGGSSAGEFDGTLGMINRAGVALNEWAMAAGTYFTGTLVPAFTNLGSWVMRNRDWLSALAVTVGVGVLAWKTFTTAITVWSAITKVAAGVQAAFNAVMMMNPIGLIIAGIAALVAGLVWFFTQTDTGKKIWAGFTSSLAMQWEVIKGAFAKGWAAVSRFLGSTWDLIKRVWSYSPLGLIVTNWGAIMDFFKGIPGKIGGFFSGLADILARPFKSGFNSVASAWNSSVGELSWTAPSWVPGIGGKTISVPKIPMLAAGGIATRATLAMVGEGAEPEAITPLSQLHRFMRDYVPRDSAAGGGAGVINMDNATFQIVDASGQLLATMRGVAVDVTQTAASAHRARLRAGV